jgi:ElaB/YqjD/DUF883 family membrane-anchored ribosome-binding protein
MNSVGSVTFDVTNLTELISSINRLGGNSATIATANLPQISASLQEFVNKLNAIGSLTFDTSGISELINSISKLGYGGITQAIANIPQLTDAIKNLLITLSKAPSVSTNVVNLVSALSSLANVGGKVETASKAIVNGLDNTTTASNRTRKGVISLAAAFGKFYATYFLVVRGIKKLWSSIESTADYIEAYNYYDVALGKIASDWEDQYEKYGYNDAESYADSFSERLNERLSKLSGLQIDLDTETLVDSGVKNLGLNITEITQYASQLASITNAVGQTGEVSLATASSFTKLAADMSSLFNVDYSDVASNLQSALIGQARAVYKYGIDITNATLQQYAYNLGVSKSVSEMTQAEKMQLRMIAILDQSRVAWGDQANTINSLSNMIRQLKNNLSEAGTVLGQLFVPMLAKIIPYINGAVIAIKRLLVSIAGIMGINLDLSSFGQGYSDLESDIDDTTDALDDATASAKKFNKQVQAFDELNILTTTDTSSTDTGTLANTLDLTNAILDATDEYEKAWDAAYAKMESKAQAIADSIEKALEPIKKLFSDIKIGDWFAVGQDVSDIVIGIEDFFIKAIEGVDWKQIGNNIGDFLAGIDWYTIIKKGFTLTFDIFDAISDVWVGSFTAAPVETTILTALAALKFTGAGSAISTALKTSLAKKGVNVSGIHPVIGILAGLATIKLIDEGTMLSNIAALVTAGIAGYSFTGDIKIGLKVAAVTLAFEGGLSFGEWLGKTLNPDDAEFYDNFTFFGEDGFFNTLVTSIQDGSWKDGIEGIKKDLGEGWDLIFQDIGDGLEDLKGKINTWATETGQDFSDWYNDRKEDFGNLGATISEWSDNAKTTFNDWKTETGKDFSDWYSDRKKDFENLGEKVGSFAEDTKTTFNNWKSETGQKFSDWASDRKQDFDDVKAKVDEWGSNTKSTFEDWKTETAQKFSDWGSDRKEDFENLKGTIGDWAENAKEKVGDWKKKASEKFEGFLEDAGEWFGENNWTFSGISDGLSSAFNSAIEAVKGIWNGFATWINDALNFEFDGFTKKFDAFGKTYEIGIPAFSVNLGVLPTFKEGGFTGSASLFYAGEDGIPEILGTVGGKSAVAGGQEITGISDTIRDTSDQQIQLLQQQNELLMQLLEKDTGISDREVFDSVRRSAASYKNMTGRSALA